MTVAWLKRGKFFGWKALAVAAVMYFALTGLLLYSFPVFLPFLCKAFGWSRASVSWANSLAMVVTGLASPFAGIYVTRHGARKAITAGGILCVLCFVVASFHTQLWQLYLAYAVLFGLGGSLCGMLSMTTIVNNWFVKKRPLALSVLLTGAGLGGLVMGFLGIRYPTRPLAILAMLLLISGMTIILWAKTLPIIFLYNSLIGLGLGGAYVAIMNLMPLYFGKTHYPKIIGFALPFFAVLPIQIKRSSIRKQ
jgi:MFS family permease